MYEQAYFELKTAEELNRDLCLFDEHTWGAHTSIAQPDRNKYQQEQDGGLFIQGRKQKGQPVQGPFPARHLGQPQGGEGQGRKIVDIAKTEERDQAQ